MDAVSCHLECDFEFFAGRIYEEDLRQRMYGYGFSYARRLTLKAWGKWMQWKKFKEFKKSNGMRYEFSMQSTLIAVHEVCFCQEICDGF